MARHWSISVYLLFLTFIFSLGIDFCNASDNTAGRSSFNGETELLQEFRRHYHGFDAAVHQVVNDQTDTFHLQLLLEDMTEYSYVVSHSHHGRPDVLNWEHTGSVGRPRAVINPNFLRWAHNHRSTTGITDFLGLSRRTVRRALLEHGIVTPGGVPFENQASVEENASNDIPEVFHPDIENAASLIQSSSRNSNMSNDTLDSFVCLLWAHYPRAGIQILHGMLRRLGQIVPYDNIRHSLIRVDPVHRVFDRIRIRRRCYTVPGPNSLWHHDGHHRMSVHNVRIERLWVDVSNYITQCWSDYLTHLELEHQLDVDNRNHIWLLQYLFLPVINQSLTFWAAGWNCHRISQRRGDGPARSPEDMWGFDMLTQGIRGDSLDQFAMTDEELEVFGVDWEGLQDEVLLQSLRRNYAHEQGSSTWFGQRGPPDQLNEVEVEPPLGSMTAGNVQLMEEALRSVPRGSDAGSVVNLWRAALVYARTTHSHAF
ncbi:hypothetical protein EV361DRAFT_807393 [Lentinula raphanica]|nr:hypothetical protein EV361DRAFT_807393 [Lentinula raphanica]